MKRTILACLGVLTLSGSALAAENIVGTWQRSNGESRVRMAPCGGAVCGTISWLKTPGKGDAKVGQQVFYDMKPDGSGGWAGSAFNPEDGKTYAGKASVSGSSMTTKGCVLGGMICKSVSWSRVN